MTLQEVERGHPIFAFTALRGAAGRGYHSWVPGGTTGKDAADYFRDLMAKGWDITVGLGAASLRVTP